MNEIKSTSVQLKNQVKIEVLKRGKDEFAGLGEISCGKVRLRNGKRPFLIRMNTPEGVIYPRLTIKKISQSGKGGVKIELDAHGILWGWQEYQDDYNQDMVSPGRDQGPFNDKLFINIFPLEQKLFGQEWKGFSYSMNFVGRERKIHRILTDATWELGGKITGNTILSQGQCNMPVYKGSRKSYFTTCCLKTLNDYGDPVGVSFQLGPRGGLNQGFDFQYSKEGILFQFWPKMESISSLIESPPNSELLHMYDEYRFELGRNVSTTPKHILFLEGKFDDESTRDIWFDAYNHVYGSMRKHFGIQPTTVVPEMGMKYKTRVDNGKLLMKLGDVEVESKKIPYVLADEILPRLAAQGIKRIFPEVMSESDVTNDGMKRKLDDGVHGDLHCSSVCATRRYMPSEFWGGLKAWKYLYKKAKSLGIELGAWFSPHFSPRSPIYLAHPEYRMIDKNSQASGGGYGFQTIVGADWNTKIFDEVLADLKKWKDEAGLDFLFNDSWSNLGLVQCHYGKNMRTNFNALGRLYAGIQKLGIKGLTYEGMAPFGVSRIGLADLRGDHLEQNKGVAGQNDFGWWTGNEEMAFNICMGVCARRRTEDEMEKLLFRAMANRAYIMWDNYDIQHKIAPWWIQLNHVYNQVLPFMEKRRLLKKASGTEWTAGKGTKIYWVYKNTDIILAAGEKVEMIEGNKIVKCPSAGKILKAKAFNVYKVTR